MKIAYFGSEESFTYLAALKRFGKGCVYIPNQPVSRIFRDVINDEVDTAVVPVENSMGGNVYDVIDELVSDEFQNGNVQIKEELSLRIVLNLISNSSLTRVRKVYSHPIPIYFCRRWLETHLPDAEVITVSSTSEAAGKARKVKTSAAIASAEAAKTYKLNLIEQNIGSGGLNVTHFFVLGKLTISGRRAKKTAVAFSLEHKSGTLYKALGVLSRADINLTRIISRPVRGGRAGHYKFFIELEGAMNEPKVKNALAKLKSQTTWINIISSYSSVKLK